MALRIKSYEACLLPAKRPESTAKQAAALIFPDLPVPRLTDQLCANLRIVRCAVWQIVQNFPD
jgi:hypothetical protein